MPKKRNENLVRIKELSVLTGQTQTTVKYYADLGLIPCQRFQGAHRVTRFFEKDKALERLKYIQKLKKKRYYIAEIIDECKKLDAKETAE